MIWLLLQPCFNEISAQNYPVQAVVTLNPPVGTSLDILANEPEKISLVLLHKDLVSPTAEVYLQMRIEAAGITIETSQSFKAPEPLILTAGMPVTLTGSDISYLFNPGSYEIQGMSRHDFLSSGARLPQGFCRFSFRAFDYNTGLAVSNWANYTTMVAGHLPPVINLPFEDSEVPASDPQYITVQFTPRHSLSPALLGKVQYKIRLIEVIPFTRNANEAMQSSGIAVFETYTPNTTFIIGPSEPQLIAGRRYAVQVQAIDVDGHESFENDGYSQVVSFVYGKKCPVPQSLQLNSISGNSASLTWSADSLHRAFELSHRQQKSFSENSEMLFRNGTEINGLRQGRVYEVLVRGVCAESSSDAVVIKFKTDTASGIYENWKSRNCGKPLPGIDLKNRRPLAFLEAGDVIHAADFEVWVLSADGDNGIFSGTGTVKLPYTGKIPIPCNFKDIRINSDYRLVEGRIQLLRKPLELSNRITQNLGDDWNRFFGTNWNRFLNKEYKGTVSNIQKTGDGRLRITGSSGDEYLSGGENYEITDGSGEVWFVSKAGKLSKREGPKGKAFVSDLKTGEGAPKKLNTGAPRVNFFALAESGYDAYEISELTAGITYDRPESSDSTYYAGWKLLKAGVTDTIYGAFFQGRQFRVHPDSIRFARTDGTEIRAERIGEEYKMTVTGRFHLYADAVWAYYYNRAVFGEPERVIVGKVNLVNVDLRKVHVVLVPVNGEGEDTDADAIESALNGNMVAQGLEYTVSVAKSLRVEAPAIEVDRSMLGTAYNKELGRFIEALELRDPWVALDQGTDTARMFILGKSSNEESGYMALNRNCGFLFLNGKRITWHTVAHETGHGLLNLEHTFPDEKQSGRSRNLMDYSPHYAWLNYSQWMQVFDGNKAATGKLRISQDAARGKMLSHELFSLTELGIPDRGQDLNFVTPDGKVITLPADSLDGITFSRAYVYQGTHSLTGGAGHANGVLTGFGFAGKSYFIHIDEGIFLGYRERTVQTGHWDNPFRYRNNTGLSTGVYAGFENGQCRLYIKKGNFQGTSGLVDLIDHVELINAETLQQVDYTTECLEYFNEEELTVFARMWWAKAKVNVNFLTNESRARRVVRLINDLGDSYRYFNYQSYSRFVQTHHPGTEPAFADPEQPFDSLILGLFENYLRTALYALADQNRIVGDLKDKDAAVRLMLTMPPATYEWFTVKSRLGIIRHMLADGLSEISWATWLEDQSEESIVVNLLTTTPPEQVSDLLDSLVIPEEFDGEMHMLAALCENSSGLDGDDYYNFTEWLLKSLIQYRPCPVDFGLAEALNVHRVLNFSSGFWGDGLVNWFTDEGKIKLISRKVFSFYTQNIEAEPYDWLYLKFTDKFDFLGRTFPENSTLKLPAVCVYAMFESENTEKLITSGKIALDAGLFLIGVGEVKAMLSAAGGVRKAWLATRAIADLGFTIGDLAISSGLGEKLEESVTGQEFLGHWNNIQLYWGVGSLAENGLSAVISKFYKRGEELKTLKLLDNAEEAELETLLKAVEEQTEVLRSRSLLLNAGKVVKGKNLLQLPAPVGEFRQLVGQVGSERRYYRAADFWKNEAASMEHYITRDGRFYIKRDPVSGQTLFLDVENEKFVGFYLDESNIFNGDYESLATSMRTVHGLEGGLTSIRVGSHVIELSKEKTNIILGRFDPTSIDPDEIGTYHILESLTILKNYSFANKNFELAPGAIHILNIPAGMESLYNSKGVEFWDAFNKNFLDIAVQNKDKVNLIFVTDPRKQNMLKTIDRGTGKMKDDASYLAREINYLVENGFLKARIRSGEEIDLSELDLSDLIF